MNIPDHDERLRRVLVEQAERVDAEPDWDDVLRRAQRRRPPVRLLAAAVLVITVLTGTALLTRDAGDDAGLVADDPTTTMTVETTSTTTSTTSTSALVQVGPEVASLDLPAGESLGADEIVAAIEIPTGEIPTIQIVVLSKSSGDVVRTLADGYDTSEGGVYDFVLTPDRRTALYVVSTAACASRIEAVAVDGSREPVSVADVGNGVAVAPDGSMIAISTGDECVGPPVMELVPVEGGRPSRYVDLGSPEHGIESMAFADGDTLLYVTVERTTEPAVQLRQLDLRSGATNALDPGPEGTSYGSLDHHEGAVTALERARRRAPALVTIEDGAITDRRDVQLLEDLGGARVGFDAGGAVLVARTGDRRLTIDGRVIRDDVVDIAL